MPDLATLALIWPLLAQTGPAPKTSPAPAQAVEPASDATAPDATGPNATAEVDPYLEQAPVDVDTLLSDSSREYLLARARLEEHPEIAAEAILDRLATVPPPTSTDRKRLLDVLAVLGLADHVHLFATELRRAVLKADTLSDEGKAVQYWLPLLVDQGPAAVGPLTTLVADRELPLTVRATLLDGLVEVTAAEELGQLVTLVGRGAKALRQQLHRSLKRRASRDPVARAALVTATDAALQQPEADRVPALLSLRGALAGDDDAEFVARLGELARDEAAAFVVRVAALRALGGRESTAAHDALTDVAQRSLAPAKARTQRDEVLAAIALQSLPPAKAQPLVEAHGLLADDAPRLAVLAYSRASLSSDHQWLGAALDNPWPQVRQAALERVQGPCEASTAKLLEHKAHLAGRQAEDDRAVARSAIAALGRCGDVDRLVGLLRDEDLDMELRAESARQLARKGDDAGIEAIGDVLGRNPERGLARRLASALRHMPKPTAAGDAVLCEAATRTDEAGHAARESLRALHEDPAAACD